MSRLNDLMDIARDSLVAKRKLLERFTDNKLYPYACHYLKDIKKRHGDYWHNHFSTIGLVGLDEGVRNLFNKGLLSESGREFGLKVLDAMRLKLTEFQMETKTPFNLEATPAEGAAYRLAMSDCKKFPQMPVVKQNKGEAFPYSNSSQPPFDAVDDPFALLDHQDDFQSKYTGGTVLHFWLGESIEDISSVKNFVKSVCSNYHLPYFTLTPTFSICPQHGYLSGEHSRCPRCGAESEIYSRVVGYLRPVKQWNTGKQQEFARRALFDKKL